MVHRNCWILVFTVAMLAFADSANGGVMGSVSIKWDEASVQLIDLSGGTNKPTLTWDGGYGFFSADAYYAEPYDLQVEEFEVFDSTSTHEANPATTWTKSSARRSATEVSAYAMSDKGTPISFVDEVYARAQVFTSSYFTMTGNGIATFLVPWEMSVTGLMDESNDWSFASVYVSGSFDDGDAFWGGSDTQLYLYSFDKGDDTRSGVFSMAVYNTGLMTLTGELYAEAAAGSWTLTEVPEPSTFVLAALGCVGVFVMAKRRQR
jgi:hypothetical protein